MGYFMGGSAMSKQIALIAGCLLASVHIAVSSNIAFDQAGNYDYAAHQWRNGANGGVGFGSWYLGTWGSGAGHFLGSAANNGFAPSGSGIDMIGPFGNHSFGLYSGSGGAVAGREFTGGALVQNQIFRLSVDNGWIDGFFGWHLETANGGADSTSLFHWHRGSSGNYLYSSGGNDDVDSGIPWTDNGLSFNFLYQGSTNYALTVYTFNSSGSIAATNTFSGYLKANESIGQFRAYTGAGNGQQYDLFINGMEIAAMPEPSTVTLIGISLLGIALSYLRRRK
jgi:hypothetical protein